MQIARRPLRRACLYFGLLFSLVLSGLGAEKSRVKAEDYVIDAEIVPRTHHLTARAKVKFTALDDTNFGTFELNNGLRVTRVADGNGRALTAERISQDNAVRVAFPNGMAKGSAITLTFEYEGTLSTADDSPVEGLKLAHIDEEFTYLLYPGRWFPITNYGIDRFSATITVTAPAGITVIGSGTAPAAARPAAAGKTVATFSWQKPSFPGTIIAGPLGEAPGGKFKVYTHTKKRRYAAL